MFRIQNTTGGPVSLTVETFDGSGPGSCSGIDTTIHFHDVSGTLLLSNDDSGIGNCSLISGYAMAAGDEVYLRVIDFSDNTAIPACKVSIVFTP